MYVHRKRIISFIHIQDAMMFPIIGSAVLFGLYLLFKTFSKEYINMLLTAYFLLVGFFSLTKTYNVIIGNFFGLKGKLIFGSFTIPRIPYVFESMWKLFFPSCLCSLVRTDSSLIWHQ
jgi:hypothetical protein